MTRAEYVSVVNKVMKFTEEKEISFSDVKDGDWYKNAIAVAVAKDIAVDMKMLPLDLMQKLQERKLR